VGDSAGRINGVASRGAAALIFRLLLRVSVYAPLRARILGPRLSHTTSSRLAVSACSMAQPGVSRHIKPRKACRGWWVILSVAALSMDVAAQEAALPGKFYRIVDGKVDPRTYNGYRRYHAVCNHCHGPDGMGSSFGPSLVDHLPDIETFRRIVHDGQSSGAAVMKGFSGDPNVAPYVDDIYAYLQARADGVLGRGRPTKLDE
jgi:mono/diheme cytochrome c family protein